jgi:hypothetical protein
MHPNQSRPVIRPTLVRDFQDPAYVITHPPFHPNVLGEDENPDEPQWFLEVPCNTWCSLFSGFSFAACIRSC